MNDFRVTTRKVYSSGSDAAGGVLRTSNLPVCWLSSFCNLLPFTDGQLQHLSTELLELCARS